MITKGNGRYTAHELIDLVRSLEGEDKARFWNWISGNFISKIRFLLLATQTGATVQLNGPTPALDVALAAICSEVMRFKKAYVRTPNNSARDQEIVRLHEEAHLSFRQIAKQMDPPMTMEAVRQAYHRYKKHGKKTEKSA